jgi:biopolymer transport protein ExbB
MQHASIDIIMDNPGSGGLVPFDVTGGAGLQTLQARDSFQTWFEKGGVFMYALLALAGCAALLVLERMVVLACHTFGMKRHIQKVKQLVNMNQVESATQYCEKTCGATGGVLHSALVHHTRDKSIIEDAVQESLLHHTPSFQARLGFISLCAAVAPLMGLLGTVTGMITTFKMVTIFGTSDPRYMAGGISEALITTQGGLYLAIPCLLFRGVLGAVADNALSKLESGAMSVVLTLLNKKPDNEPGPMSAGGENTVLNQKRTPQDGAEKAENTNPFTGSNPSSGDEKGRES